MHGVEFIDYIHVRPQKTPRLCECTTSGGKQIESVTRMLLKKKSKHESIKMKPNSYQDQAVDPNTVCPS